MPVVRFPEILTKPPDTLIAPPVELELLALRLPAMFTKPPETLMVPPVEPTLSAARSPTMLTQLAGLAGLEAIVIVPPCPETPEANMVPLPMDIEPANRLMAPPVPVLALTLRLAPLPIVKAALGSRLDILIEPPLAPAARNDPYVPLTGDGGDAP